MAADPRRHLLRGIYLVRDQVPAFDRYPFSVPQFSTGGSMPLGCCGGRGGCSTGGA